MGIPMKKSASKSETAWGLVYKLHSIKYKCFFNGISLNSHGDIWHFPKIEIERTFKIMSATEKLLQNQEYILENTRQKTFDELIDEAMSEENE